MVPAGSAPAATARSCDAAIPPMVRSTDATTIRRVTREIPTALGFRQRPAQRRARFTDMAPVLSADPHPMPLSIACELFVTVRQNRKTFNWQNSCASPRRGKDSSESPWATANTTCPCRTFQSSSAAGFSRLVHTRKRAPGLRAGAGRCTSQFSSARLSGSSRSRRSTSVRRGTRFSSSFSNVYIPEPQRSFLDDPPARHG